MAMVLSWALRDLLKGILGQCIWDLRYLFLRYTFIVMTKSSLVINVLLLMNILCGVHRLSFSYSIFIKLIVSVRIILIEPHLTVCQDGLCIN